MNNFKCRLCGNRSGFFSVIETEVPLAANVTDEPQVGMKRYPLYVVRCNSCGHVQLKETLDASFYEDYLYTPSYASGFVKYIDWFVNWLCSKIDKPERKVIEIGSSNGYLLGKLQEREWHVLGVEPSTKLSKAANEMGIKTVTTFFSKNTVEQIKSAIGQPDVLIFRHVIEHLDSLEDIVQGMKNIIGDGLLLIEVPYLKRIITENQFYGFFHEHLSYYSVTALRNLLQKGNLYIHNVMENDLEGGSILHSSQ